MMYYFEIIIIALQFTHTIARHHSSSEESIENLLYFKDCQKTTVPPIRERLSDSTPAPKPEIFCTMCCGENCLTSAASSMRGQRERFQSMSMGMGGHGNGMGGMGPMGGMGQMGGMGHMGQMGHVGMGHMSGMHGSPNPGMHQGMGGMRPPQPGPQKPPSFLHNMQNTQMSPDQQPIKRSHRMRQLPISRRTISKEYLKTIISQDQDIKKILKDLVRVTMQKLDLEQMLNNRNTVDNNNNMQSGRRSEQRPPPPRPPPPTYKESEVEGDDANDVDTDYEIYEYEYD